MIKQLSILFLVVVFASCAKKEDWECSCEIYTATTTTIEKKELKNMIRTDADRECTKFGEEKAGKNGAFECTLK